MLCIIHRYTPICNREWRLCHKEYRPPYHHSRRNRGTPRKGLTIILGNNFFKINPVQLRQRIQRMKYQFDKGSVSHDNIYKFYYTYQSLNDKVFPVTGLFNHSDTDPNCMILSLYLERPVSIVITLRPIQKDEQLFTNYTSMLNSDLDQEKHMLSIMGITIREYTAIQKQRIRGLKQYLYDKLDWLSYDYETFINKIEDVSKALYPHLHTDPRSISPFLFQVLTEGWIILHDVLQTNAFPDQNDAMKTFLQKLASSMGTIHITGPRIHLDRVSCFNRSTHYTLLDLMKTHPDVRLPSAQTRLPSQVLIFGNQQSSPRTESWQPPDTNKLFNIHRQMSKTQRLQTIKKKVEDSITREQRSRRRSRLQKQLEDRQWRALSGQIARFGESTDALPDPVPNLVGQQRRKKIAQLAEGLSAIKTIW